MIQYPWSTMALVRGLRVATCVAAWWQARSKHRLAYRTRIRLLKLSPEYLIVWEDMCEWNPLDEGLPKWCRVLTWEETESFSLNSVMELYIYTVICMCKVKK
jgi:hypothetical protein